MSGTADVAGTRLTLDLWHPDCWAIESTDAVGGGVLAHAIYSAPTDGERVNGLFTAFGETETEVERLLDTIESSPHCGDILDLRKRFGGRRRSTAPSNVVREFFLEYDPTDMICPTLLKHGFVHSAPVRIQDGREYWQVCFAGERSEIEPSLEEVREDGPADVSVESITASDTATGPDHQLDRLTRTQREVFELARGRGYYEWPRGISTRDLAAEADISKTTLLEHLRKAEAKLLDP